MVLHLLANNSLGLGRRVLAVFAVLVAIEARTLDAEKKTEISLSAPAKCETAPLKPAKDNWDKISAVAPVISGVLVALIGFYATHIYSARQRALEDQRKDQEVNVSKIQTVEKFIPHLSSSHEPTKRAALIAISALGEEELAIKLAEVFTGPGATSALATIVSTAAPENSAKAADALKSVFKSLRASVVAIYMDGKRSATGFVASPDGLIITAGHVAAQISRRKLEVRLPSNLSVPARVIAVDPSRDLGLIQIEADESLVPLGMSPAKLVVGELVVAMTITLDDAIQTQVGEINSLDNYVSLNGHDLNLIGISVNVTPGTSGTPVVDRSGQLVGLVNMGDKRTGYLVPAQSISEFMDNNANAVEYVPTPASAKPAARKKAPSKKK